MFHAAMQSVALGLTCRDAFVVFSQNETLRLQAEIAEQKMKLEKVVKAWKRKCQRQKEQLEWARRKLYDEDIRTGCVHGSDCDDCGIFPGDVGVCMCPLSTCRCNRCVSDEEDLPKRRSKFKTDSNLPSPVRPTYEEACIEFEKEILGMRAYSDTLP